MIHKIAIGLAFSPNLKANLFEAIRCANLFNAELIAIHVGYKTTEKTEQLQLLLDEAPYLKQPLTTVWKQGNPVSVILETCERGTIDLLILGAIQKENLYKYYVGSIARRLTRKAPCSVLLLIKPSIERVPCQHMIVNGLKDTRTEQTIQYAIKISKAFECKRVTIVEEISQTELAIKVSDDKTLRQATIIRERIQQREDLRIKEILSEIDTKGININTQSIFGRCGYSIGHYAKVKHADLLVMNAPLKTRVLDRLFPHDIEYILSELPTDVLIVK